MVFSKRSEFLSFFWCRIEVFFAKGPEVEESHKVQSVRAVVEQTIRDLKCFKIMDGNKIKAVAEFEEVLDCVIALHNLRVLLKANKAFDLLPRRVAVPGDHVFKPKIPQKDVDLKIPADAPDLSKPEYRDIRDFKGFLAAAAPAVKNALEKKGRDCIFFPTVKIRGPKLVQRCLCASITAAERVVGCLDCEIRRWGFLQLRNTHWLCANVEGKCCFTPHL